MNLAITRTRSRQAAIQSLTNVLRVETHAGVQSQSRDDMQWRFAVFSEIGWLARLLIENLDSMIRPRLKEAGRIAMRAFAFIGQNSFADLPVLIGQLDVPTFGSVNEAVVQLAQMSSEMLVCEKSRAKHLAGSICLICFEMAAII